MSNRHYSYYYYYYYFFCLHLFSFIKISPWTNVKDLISFIHSFTKKVINRHIRQYHLMKSWITPFLTFQTISILLFIHFKCNAYMWFFFSLYAVLLFLEFQVSTFSLPVYFLIRISKTRGQKFLCTPHVLSTDYKMTRCVFGYHLFC